MRLLLVEDEKKVADLVARGLRVEHFAVDVAYDGESGWQMAHLNQYDLIILDSMLPGLNGLEVLTRIRKRSNSFPPVLVLTAREVTMEKVENFPAAADDYLSKPFAFTELVGRIKALLRCEPAGRATTLRISDLEIDRRTQQVQRDGQRIDLTPKEYALLEYLAGSPGRVFSRTMIVDHVWDQSFEGATNIVDVCVQHLRAKVDGQFATKLIRTVRGVGYMISDSAEP